MPREEVVRIGPKGTASIYAAARERDAVENCLPTGVRGTLRGAGMENLYHPQDRCGRMFTLCHGIGRIFTLCHSIGRIFTLCHGLERHIRVI